MACKPPEVERLARVEHERWFGEQSDHSQTYPCLVPSEAFPEDDKDRNFVRNLPRIPARVGLPTYRMQADKADDKIVRTR